MFGQIYAGKRVLVTGHTGFKGSWLTTWLLKLGAKVAGLSDCIPTEPSMFDKTGLAANIEHHLGDVRDLATVRQVIEDFQPDFVFHLAAQAIVSTWAPSAPTSSAPPTCWKRCGWSTRSAWR
jgi:CDP-glucose 4,6-dehydratase